MPHPDPHIIITDSTTFVDIGATTLRDQIEQTIRTRGTCVLGLSGGSTPKPIYELLGTMNLDWSKLWIFLVDERYTPATSPDSNTTLVIDTLLQGAPPNMMDHFVRPDTSLPLHECVATYDATLIKLFNEHGFPDIVTLGLGEDGHIASLFPPLPDAVNGESMAIHTTTDCFAARDRISVTLPVLQKTPSSIFFLKGEEKKRVWEEMLASKDGIERWPAKALSLETMTIVMG